jgi:hypothetical protein
MVDATTADPEKAIDSQQNCTTLATTYLDQCLPILALAEQLDLMLTAILSLANWERKLARNWFNFGNLTIIS